MNGSAYSLAIETSSRRGAVALGVGDSLLETLDLGEQRRHAVALMPGIDRLCRQHGVAPGNIAEIYVSVGPGSFTGLRVGVTTAKVLSRVTGAKLVAVPTLQVVAHNVLPDRATVAVMLNAKGGRCFTAVYKPDRAVLGPCLMTPAELCDVYRGPVLGDQLPPHDWPADIELLDPALATPRGEAVWEIGRRMAQQGRFTPKLELTPLYVRLPEAEELWQARNLKAL